MTPKDLIDDLRSRINPAYAAQLGTESYERRLCAEALESLLSERDELVAALQDVVAISDRKHDAWDRAKAAIAAAKGHNAELSGRLRRHDGQ